MIEEKRSTMGQAETEQGGKRLYVSDAVDMTDIRKGQLNLVYAPCGSGKTYFVEHKLKECADDPSQDVLYLVPTISLREAFELRGEDFEAFELWNGAIAYERKQEGFTAMTYAAFGAKIQKAREKGTYRDGLFWNDHSVICADELSQAVKQSHFSGGSANFTKVALEELKKRIANKTNTVVTVSATPKPFLDDGFFLFPGKMEALTRLVKMFFRPEGYKDGCVESYHNLKNLLKKLDASQRGMIYVTQITQIDRAVSLLQDRGINAVGIFSTNNSDHKMSREQMAVRKSLIRDEKIPEDVQVLVINAAYETGLNIRPEKSRLDYIVVHDKNEATQVQVRGRYRGDIETVYYRREPEDGLGEIPEDVIAPYLGRRLTSDDKKRLCGELGFKDKRGRTLGWRTVKPLLEAQGYEVLEKKSGGDRYTVINIGE